MKLFNLILVATIYMNTAAARAEDSITSCKMAFEYKTDDAAIANTIQLCTTAKKMPVGYSSEINMPVCDDKLCANVILKFHWDLAGNYSGFDTISGKPLTKFDHLKFSSTDYQKLDRILKNRNSILRIIEKEELTDKSIHIRAATVDAVTGATPASLKNAVIAGAGYTSYTLWHFVNGNIKDQMMTFTKSIYSDSIAHILLKSTNFETQLFALQLMPSNDFERNIEMLFAVIQKNMPIISAYIINKAVLPFHDPQKNIELASRYPELDSYSKSTFMNKVISNKETAEVFIPLLLKQLRTDDKKEKEKLMQAIEKYQIIP